MLFDINRSLTGMAIERYDDSRGVAGDRWCDELARRLFDIGVTRCTVYSSSVIAEAPDWSARRDRAEETIRNLYVFYLEGQGADQETESDEAPTEPGESSADATA